MTEISGKSRRKLRAPQYGIRGDGKTISPDKPAHKQPQVKPTNQRIIKKPR